MKQHQRVVHIGNRQRTVRWIGKGSKADKSVRQGGTLLLKPDEWCDLSEIKGHDPDVLYSPTIEKAFSAVVRNWKPRLPVALVSLCTATRPYTASRKWSKYVKALGPYADLIVHSNGGIIPLDYEDQFPFLNYDAHGEAKYDDMYVEVGIERMKRFFKAHPYRFVVFNFRHNMRNRRVSDVVGPWLVEQGLSEECIALPTQAQYERSQAENFRAAGYSMYPELWRTMYDPLVLQVKDYARRAAGGRGNKDVAGAGATRDSAAEAPARKRRTVRS